MCQIYLKGEGADMGFENFKTAILNNPDGFGYTYPDDHGKLVVVKDPKEPDPETLYRTLVEDLKDRKVLCHLRYTTAGATSLRNAHPFPILEKRKHGIDMRMAHNGTIFKYKPGNNSSESDTRVFVREYVRPLMERMVKGYSPEELTQDGFLRKLLEDQLPSASVLCFLDGNGNALLANPLGNGGKFVGESGEPQLWYANSYSHDPKHRSKSVVPFRPTPTKTTTGKSGSTSVSVPATVVATTNAWCPNDMKTRRFSSMMGVKPEELTALSDQTINQVLTQGTFEHKVSLVKELLLLLSQEKKKNEGLTRKLKEAVAK